MGKLIQRIFILAVGCMLTFNNLQAFEPPRMHPADRLMVNLFADVWQNTPANMEVKGLQRGFSISALQDMPMGRTNFSMAAGLGFTSHNLYSNCLYRYHYLLERYAFVPITRDYKKNKLSLNYIEVPVQVRFRSRNLSRTFRAYVGVQAGYLINGHTKFEGEMAFTLPENLRDQTGLEQIDRDVKFKEHHLEQIEDYRIGVTGTIGFGSVNFHMYYPLSNIFKDNNGADMRPLSLGMTLILF